MKSKRLLIVIAIVAFLLVLLICLSAICSVKKVTCIYHLFDGYSTTAYSEGAPTEDEVLAEIKGNNIVFLDKAKIMEQFETDNWHAFAVIRTSYNEVTVHFIQKVLAVKIVASGQDIFLDSNGIVMQSGNADGCVDITSAFDVLDIDNQTVNRKLTFSTDENNQRLEQILKAMSAIWQCNVEMENIPQVIGESKVFKFDDEGSLIVEMSSKAKIIINAPDTDLESRLIKAFSAYYNAEENLQREGVIITVRKDGTMTTSK